MRASATPNRDWRPAAGVVVMLVVATGVMLAARAYLPRWTWASDLCPSASTTCGQLPVAAIVGVLLGVVTVGVIKAMLTRFEGDR